MKVLTVNTAIGIFTLSILVIVVVVVGYMDENRPSVFDVWWKPLALGSALSVLPLLGLLALKKKDHFNRLLTGQYKSQSPSISPPKVPRRWKKPEEIPWFSLSGGEFLNEKEVVGKLKRRLENLKGPYVYTQEDFREMTMEQLGEFQLWLRFRQQVEGEPITNVLFRELQNEIQARIKGIETEKKTKEESINEEIQRLEKKKEEMLQNMFIVDDDEERTELIQEMAEKFGARFNKRNIEERMGSLEGFSSNFIVNTVKKLIESAEEHMAGLGKPQKEKEYEDFDEFTRAAEEYKTKIRDYAERYHTYVTQNRGSEGWDEELPTRPIFIGSPGQYPMSPDEADQKTQEIDQQIADLERKKRETATSLEEQLQDAKTLKQNVKNTETKNKETIKQAARQAAQEKRKQQQQQRTAAQ